MIVARFEFKESCSDYFCPGPNQTVIEILFESPEALVSTAKGFGSSLSNCLALINDKVCDLREISGLSASP